MTKQEDALRSALKRGLRYAQGSTPSFASVWAAAEQRSTRQRGIAIAGLSAAAAALLALGFLTSGDDAVRYVDVDELMGSTSWSAPSDFLLPERRYDVYQEIPLLFESTESYGGTLL